MDRKFRKFPKLCRIDQLPDDVLLLILSLLPTLGDRARTSILSQRWRNIWHNINYLDLDAFTLMPRDLLASERHYRFIALLNQVISIPRSSLVKGFRISYPFAVMDGRHINGWVDFAIANRVETLQLDFHLISYHQRYNLSEECWHRIPSGVSGLSFLKSLVLSSVNVSKQFIEFIFSSCPLLEEFSLSYAGTFFNLDISGPQLNRLRIDHVEGSALKKLYAPRLTSFYFISYSGGFNPQKIDAPMLTDLTIGGKSGSQHVMSYLEHFLRYLPQLEKLDLVIGEKQSFKLKQIPELVKLKYLKMRFYMDTDPIFLDIIKFLNAFPVLETFVIKIPDVDVFPPPWETILNRMRESYTESFCNKSIMRRRRKLECLRLNAEESCTTRFESLKVLELVGKEERLIDQEIVKFIISKTPPSFEKVKVMIKKLQRSPSSKLEIMEVVKAKLIELCRPQRVEIDVDIDVLLTSNP